MSDSNGLESGAVSLTQLSRPDRYMLASKADVDIRVVDSEWARWLEGASADGPVRARVRRVAIELGFAK